MKLEELTTPGWADAENYFRECDREYGTAELMVPVVFSPNTMSNSATSSMAQPPSPPGTSHLLLRIGKPVEEFTPVKTVE